MTKLKGQTVRIGIIGTGTVARQHAAAIAMLGTTATLVAAADIAPAKLDEFCNAFGVARKYGKPGELLADAGVDLVAITTPPVAHEALALAALQNGKYVFCEKPLAASLASARRIADAAALYPGRLSVSYQFRYGLPFRRLRWLCANGWIGDIQSARVERHSIIPHLDHGNGGWWGSWSVAGGGVLMTQLIHELDLLQIVMGRPIAVQAAMDTRYSTIEAEDFVEATIRFEGGASARCIGSVNSGRLTGGLTIRGSNGSVGFPWHLAIDDSNRLAAATRALNRALPDSARHDQPLTAHACLYREIALSIVNGEPLPVSATEALPSLELCVAAYESALSGTEVTLPLGRGIAVYDGISKDLYDARVPAKRCYYGVRNITGDSLLPPVVPSPPTTARAVARRLAARIVRRALEFVKMDPAAIRALARRAVPVHGGLPVRTWPWPQRRHFDAREKRAVMRVIDREIRRGGAVVYGGPEEEAYCAAFAQYLGGGYADAVNSGTNAIYIALRALDLQPGSEVVVAPVSDAGGIMPVVMNLCVPVPADSAPGSILTDTKQIEAVLTDRTAAILVTHLGGHPVDMDPVLALAAARGIPVVEDCAQAHGAIYKGQMVGTLGTISAFSTMFSKHHATGAQGGVVFAKDILLFARAKAIADRGKAYDDAGHQANVIASLNFNQDEISMAIGCVQLAKLPAAIEARRRFASVVERGLAAVDGAEFIGDPHGCRSSYLFVMIRLDPHKIRSDSQVFAAALQSEGIEGAVAGYSVYPTDQIWHHQRAVFGQSGLPWSMREAGQSRWFELPNAHEANRWTVRVDIHEALGEREARDLVAAVRKLATYYRTS